MMKRICKLILLLILIAEVSCQKQSAKQVKEEISFKNYVKRLPQISLPYYFACDSSFIGSSSWWAQIDDSDTLIKKYRPKYAGIVGKVYESEQSIGVLYTFAADVSLPVIVITDTAGVNLGAVELYELGNCAWGDNLYGEYSSIIQGQITKDMHIFSTLEVIDCDTVRCDTVRKYMTKKN